MTRTSSTRSHFLRIAWGPAWVLLTLPAIGLSSGFGCNTEERCGLPDDGPYPHLVLGTVAAVADAAEAEEIYHWARAQGYWSSLPEDPAAFVKAIQILSLELPSAGGTERMTFLMGRVHFDAIRIAPGDYVRYIPRESYPSGQETPMSKKTGEPDAYRQLYGCIALLCRAEDLLCPARYRSGVYRPTDGAPLDPQTGTVLTQGTHVDPVTYLPVAAPPHKK